MASQFDVGALGLAGIPKAAGAAGPAGTTFNPFAGGRAKSAAKGGFDIAALFKDPVGSIKKFSKTSEAKWLGGGLILDMIIKNALGIGQQAQEGRQQGAAMDLQTEFAPQIAQEQAQQPITQAQKEQAMMMLMRQMGMQQSNLAEGEVFT
ncbi:MAG: hypothetical protein GY934_22395 [Gammaproteobacteria bacterium]|nr:hypothetical protein [Gammaproteobacteria bacterium]